MALGALPQKKIDDNRYVAVDIVVLLWCVPKFWIFKGFLILGLTAGLVIGICQKGRLDPRQFSGVPMKNLSIQFWGFFGITIIITWCLGGTSDICAIVRSLGTSWRCRFLKSKFASSDFPGFTLRNEQP